MRPAKRWPAAISAAAVIGASMGLAAPALADVSEESTAETAVEQTSPVGNADDVEANDGETTDGAADDGGADGAGADGADADMDGAAGEEAAAPTDEGEAQDEAEAPAETDMADADDAAALSALVEVATGEADEPADLIDLNILNINDFHGRIDGTLNDAKDALTASSTVNFAYTLEKLKAEHGYGNSLFLSAGDNLGASLFASALKQDEPTIDMLNALGLEATASGNHEFDGGWPTDVDRIASLLDAPILAANVIDDSTGKIAAPFKAYDIVEAAGLKVAVIGVVTQETPTLVNPANVAGLTFLDPVDTLNKVVTELQALPADEQPDIIVAEYHEGSGVDEESAGSLQEALDDSAVFAKIVNGTDAAVDVIFTGHTHKRYAWEAPIPGGDGATRPVLETGSYGEYIGQVVLTVDTETNAVASYTVDNVKVEGAAMDVMTENPVVDEVYDIVLDAMQNADKVGSQVTGYLSAPITRAYTAGEYGADGTFQVTANSAENRGQASTMGTLVGNMLKESMAGLPEAPDFGVLNPGGLRTDLYPAADGAITVGQARAVLPFNNELSVVTLTGEQIVTMLEQQWQRNADGSVPSRSYLQLGLSDNVAYTYSVTQEEVPDKDSSTGTKLVDKGMIESVTIDGEPLDLAASYKVGTFEFLASGGDNFWVFQEASKRTDTGFLDWESWLDYLATGTQENPIEPDFVRQGVQVQVGATGEAWVGAETEIVVSGTNIHSVGAPANTELSWAFGPATTRATEGTSPIETTQSDSGVWTDSATIPFQAPDQTGVIPLSLSAAPTGTGALADFPVPVVVPTIAEIRDSAELNTLVTTEGWVTASYPTGGFNGFVIQSAGSGGVCDFDSASDAIFVYTNHSNNIVPTPAIGSYVKVSGTYSAYNGLFQINAGPAKTVDERVTVIEDTEGIEPAEAVTCAWPDGDSDSLMAIQSMLYQPEADLVVTNNYQANQFGQLDLATGGEPLKQPTDVAPYGSEKYEEVVAYNEAHKVSLGSGATWNYLGAANNGFVPPYVEATDLGSSVGATVELTEPLILDYRNNTWRLNPIQQIIGESVEAPTQNGTPSGIMISDEYPLTFSYERPDAPTADELGNPDLVVGGFNLENYFPTSLGEDWNKLPGANCTSYNDRFGNPITVNRCSDVTQDGVTVSNPRGAWSQAALDMQTGKLVEAINSLDASALGVMELENSYKLSFGDASKAGASAAYLVAALNEAAGTDKWAYIEPNLEQLPPIAQQDVMYPGIIYQPGKVTPIGDNLSISDQSGEGGVFSNARAPFGQAFEPVDGGEPFFLVANHFKSKSSPAEEGENADNGQGGWNASRTAQAKALATWIDEVALPTLASEGTVVSDVVLVGDFNSYTFEDPMLALYDAGYVNVNVKDGVPENVSYNYSGLNGSLDHVIVSSSTIERITGHEIWGINHPSTIAVNYSRFDVTAGDFVQDNLDKPWRSSDHDPAVVGFSAEKVAPVEPWITLDPATVEAGGSTTVTGGQWIPGAEVTLSFGTVARSGADAVGTTVEVVAGEDGTFATELVIPADTEEGDYRVIALGSEGDQVASAALTVTSAAVTPPPGERTPSISVDPAKVVAGGTVTVTGKDFVPGETVSFSIGDKGIEGSVVVGADGTFSVKVAVAKDLKAGTYTLTAKASGGDVATASLVVTAAGAGGGAGGSGSGGLPSTGADVMLVVLAALMLAGAGVATKRFAGARRS